jgi:hypothetical protein
LDIARVFFTAQGFRLKKNIFVFSAFLLGVAAVAQAQSALPTKVGIIHVEGAVLNTKERQKAVAEWNAKFRPQQAELEKEQASITSMEDQLRRGSVIDVSQPQIRPVFWAADAVNITNEIIQLYDKAYPVAGATTAPATTKTAGPPTSPAAAPNKQ